MEDNSILVFTSVFCWRDKEMVLYITSQKAANPHRKAEVGLKNITESLRNYAEKHIKLGFIVFVLLLKKSSRCM